MRSTSLDRFRTAARRATRALGLALLVAGLGACDSGPATSLYDPDFQGQPDPVISSVSPQGLALAGVSEVTITGQHFTADTSKVRVYFNGSRAQMLAASPTQLRVKAPNLPADDLRIRVSVLGALNFSNATAYRLEAAVAPFSDIKAFEEPFAVANDAQGNLYMSLFSNNVSAGIKRVAPSGERSDYITTTFKWDGMDFGPDGALYTARNVFALFRFAGAGAGQQTWVVVPSTARLTTLDHDAQGNIWTGGTGGNLYRVKPDKSHKAFAFTGTVRALKVSGNHLYAAATRDGKSGVWRMPIDAAGELGAAELFYDVAGKHNGAEAFSLAFAANGDLFVGTSAADPILVVRPDRSGDVLYPGLLSPTATGLAWGPGTTLYMVRSGTKPGLFRINTLREGAP